MADVKVSLVHVTDAETGDLFFSAFTYKMSRDNLVEFEAFLKSSPAVSQLQEELLALGKEKAGAATGQASKR